MRPFGLLVILFYSWILPTARHLASYAVSVGVDVTKRSHKPSLAPCTFASSPGPAGAVAIQMVRRALRLEQLQEYREARDLYIHAVER